MKRKQITFDKKLSLDLQIVGKLDSLQMDAIDGGVTIQTLTCVNRTQEGSDEGGGVSCAACSCNNSGPNGC
jgi:hypothetical protein